MNEQTISHELHIINRNNINLSGVKKIIKFDKHEFIIDTIQGVVTLMGDNLELVSLDNQAMTTKIKGTIYSFSYADKNKKQENILAKLFK